MYVQQIDLIQKTKSPKTLNQGFIITLLHIHHFHNQNPFLNLNLNLPTGEPNPTSMAPKQKTPHSCRNPDLIRGVGKYSRSKMYHKRGLWAIKAKNGGTFPHHEKKPAVTPAAVKPPKFYPADDIKKPLVNKRKAKPTKLRYICFKLINF